MKGRNKNSMEPGAICYIFFTILVKFELSFFSFFTKGVRSTEKMHNMDNESFKKGSFT